MSYPHSLKTDFLVFQKPEKLFVIAAWRGRGDPTHKPTTIKALGLTDQASLARTSETLALVFTGFSASQKALRCCDSLSYLEMTSAQTRFNRFPFPSPGIACFQRTR